MSAGAIPAPAPRAEPGAPWDSAFDELPHGMRVRAFGVEYAHVRPPDGGDLYLTRDGWPLGRALCPSQWYAGEWYAQQGLRLPGSSGHVYRVRTRPVDGLSADLVVKFSRVAQDVSVVIETTFPEDIPPAVLAEARYNSPMEEFGLVMELRRGDHGPRELKILTQRPLAIYAPPQEFDLWELGRSSCRFFAHHQLLSEDQRSASRAIELDIRRIYVLLYGWIKGRDAEECFLAGVLDEAEFRALTPRVIRELEAKGFRVIDNKPKHFILRPRPWGLLRRGGDAVYGLVDFEFLQRTQEHQRQFRSERRERYWAPPAETATAAGAPMPADVVPATVFGVDYLFSNAPEGGRLWAVGRDPGLTDYFLPDRWRRTPRVRISGTSEVYRTRTRDGVDVVYRLSRVGVRPRIASLSEPEKRIREHGTNSPFEEIAIAQRLAEMGIATVRPRAIWRTGHESTTAPHVRDLRRFEDHAAILTPDQPPEPILSPEYDYYSIWDYFRGADPMVEPGPDGAQGVLDLERAREEGWLAADECAATLAETRRRLLARGLPAEALGEEEVVVFPERGGEVRRGPEGVAVVLSLDALTAYEYGLLDDAAYTALLQRVDERLRAVDCEKLDPNGRHLLLTMNPDGRFERDASGEVHVTLCNFALIRGMYRPIR